MVLPWLVERGLYVVECSTHNFSFNITLETSASIINYSRGSFFSFALIIRSHNKYLANSLIIRLNVGQDRLILSSLDENVFISYIATLISKNDLFREICRRCLDI